MNHSLNVAVRLTEMAKVMPDALAVIEPLHYDNQGNRQYRHFTFRQLDQDSNRIAHGLRQMGVLPGTRLAVLIRPGIDFVSAVFGLLKAGAVSILIDPGMGKRKLVKCLQEAEPEGFVAISLVQAIRVLLRQWFPRARLNVTIGRRWFWGGATLEQFRGQAVSDYDPAPTRADDPAAIIFTTGSTGPPKGVLFTHGNFNAQVEQIREMYDIRPGEVDLPGFPLFGLFNCALGVTAVIPDMDPSRPAQVDPLKIIEAIRDWNVTQTFGSPAIWNRVGQYCQEHGIRLPTVRRVLSAGAPVPAEVLGRMKSCIHPDGDVHTPYGATEALPVASIAAGEVLGETAAQTRQGAGVCVGRKFPGIDWKVIRIVEGPIPSINDIEELPPGEIGELIVRGPQVTKCYVTRKAANKTAKIMASKKGTSLISEDLHARFPDGCKNISDVPFIWHRMGDTGYLDNQGRFWYCGRVAHRVLTAEGPLYPIRCEAIFNQHPDIFRSALVGVGPPGRQRPVVILQPRPGKFPATKTAKKVLLEELKCLGKSNALTQSISDFLFHPSFPVDIRHNVKIFREKLALWAREKLRA